MPLTIDSVSWTRSSIFSQFVITISSSIFSERAAFLCRGVSGLLCEGDDDRDGDLGGDLGGSQGEPGRRSRTAPVFTFFRPGVMLRIGGDMGDGEGDRPRYGDGERPGTDTGVSRASLGEAARPGDSLGDARPGDCGRGDLLMPACDALLTSPELAGRAQ